MVRLIRILTYPLYMIGVAFEVAGIGLQLPDEYVCGNVNINVATGAEEEDPE